MGLLLYIYMIDLYNMYKIIQKVKEGFDLLRIAVTSLPWRHLSLQTFQFSLNLNPQPTTVDHW